MTFQPPHDAYLKEFKALSKHIPSLQKDVERIERLLDAHFFNPQTKGEVIKPGKIHRISVENDATSRELWKVEVMVPGLRPNQWPRLWFMLDGETITFLAIASHVDNYDNNAMDRRAVDRYRDIADS